MKTSKTNGFVVWEQSNKCDGHGYSFSCATTLTRKAAEKEAVGKGVMGFPGDIISKEVFVFEFKGEKYCVPVDQCTLVEKPELDCENNSPIRRRGKVISFDSSSSQGQVEIGQWVYDFPSTSFVSIHIPRFPKPGDDVDVLFKKTEDDYDIIAVYTL